MELVDCIVLTALLVALVALAGGIWVCLSCKRMRRELGRSLVIRLREQDRVECELERTRVEKAAIEKILRARLSQSPESAESVNPLESAQSPESAQPLQPPEPRQSPQPTPAPETE